MNSRGNKHIVELHSSPTVHEAPVELHTILKMFEIHKFTLKEYEKL